MITTACVATQLSALLPLLPMAVRHVTGSTARSGAVTAAAALGTVFIELGTPRLLARWSARAALAGGFVAIGVALSGLALLPDFLVMMILGVTFGLGFGVAVTVGSTVVGKLTDPRDRGRAWMHYGIAAGLPMVVAPPLALFAVPHVGLGPVFAAGAVFAGIGLLASRGAPVRWPASAASVALAPATRDRRVTLPLLVLVCVMFTYGGVVSLTPFVVRDHGLSSDVVFFLLLGAFRTVGRSASAALLPRLSTRRLFLPGIGCSACGLVCLALPHLTFELLAAIAFGLGNGTVQTASFIAMLEGGRIDAAAPVTALWNVAIDGGTGLGALVLAPVAVAIGYRATFLVMFGISLLAAGLWLTGPVGRLSADQVVLRHLDD